MGGRERDKQHPSNSLYWRGYSVYNQLISLFFSIICKANMGCWWLTHENMYNIIQANSFVLLRWSIINHNYIFVELYVLHIRGCKDQLCFIHLTFFSLFGLYLKDDI
jgi:hypothetical protein